MKEYKVEIIGGVNNFAKQLNDFVKDGWAIDLMYPHKGFESYEELTVVMSRQINLQEI